MQQTASSRWRLKSWQQLCQELDADYHIPRPATAQHLPAYQAAMHLLGVCGEAVLLVVCGFLSAFLFVKASHWIEISIWVEIGAHCLGIIAVLIGFVEAVPGANLEVHGIPKVPASLAQKVRRYTNAYGLPLAGWDPAKREVWLKGISNRAWVSRIEAPGNFPQTWLNIQAAGVYDLYFQPQAKYLVYNRDADGDEAFQMYLYDIEKRSSKV